MYAAKSIKHLFSVIECKCNEHPRGPLRVKQSNGDGYEELIEGTLLDDIPIVSQGQVLLWLNLYAESASCMSIESMLADELPHLDNSKMARMPP